MNIKKETGDILEFLKKKGYSRRQIEEDLAYKEKYIDQAYSRGDSEELLIRLRFYKKYVLLETICINSTFLVPGPEASLKQLLKVQRELLIADEKIDKRIDEIISGENDNSSDGTFLNQNHKDSVSKKGKPGRD